MSGPVQGVFIYLILLNPYYNYTKLSPFYGKETEIWKEIT